MPIRLVSPPSLLYTTLINPVYCLFRYCSTYPAALPTHAPLL